MGSVDKKCLVLVAVFGILVFAVMAAALITRFVIYQDISFIAMPTDMRVINRQESSIFCNSHVVATSLHHHTGEGEITNTVPRFDMFLLDDDPRDRRSVSLVHLTDTVIGDRRMKPGTFSYHAFNFLADSFANISFCSEALTADSHVVMPKIQATAVRGWADFDIIKERLETPSDSSPCQPPVDCLYHHQYEVTSCADKDWFNVELEADVSDQYITIFSYPRIPENATFTQPDIKLGTRYHLNRTQYDLAGLEPKTTDDVSGSIESNKYILLNFKYLLNQTEGSLYNIEVQLKCDPHIMVYFGVFFSAFVVLVAVVAIVLYKCVWSRASGRPRFVSLSYGNQDPAGGAAGDISGYGNPDPRSYTLTLEP